MPEPVRVVCSSLGRWTPCDDFDKREGGHNCSGFSCTVWARNDTLLTLINWPWEYLGLFSWISFTVCYMMFPNRSFLFPLLHISVQVVLPRNLVNRCRKI